MLLFVLMHSLISCSSTEDVGLEEEKGTGSKQDMPIDFSVDAVSRAVDLSTVHDNFCVRSFKENADGTKSLVMSNYLVKDIDNEWVYNGLANVDGGAQYLKYWDLTANSYTFAAVTPATAAGSTFSIDDNGIATINIADMATEWMIARTIRRGVNNASALLDYDDIAEDIEAIDASATKTSDVFPKPNAPYAEVPLNFHRIMAKIVIKAYAESETEFKPLAVGLNNIGTAPATYNTSTGWTTTAVDYQPLYGVSGLLYRNLEVKAGMNVYRNLDFGIYIALGKKVLIR